MRCAVRLVYHFELDLTSGSTAVVYGYSYYNTTKGALTKLTISGDESYSKPVTIKTSMTEADFSGKNLGASGAIMLAAFLPKCR